MKRSRDGHLDLVLFWKSNAADLPELYKLAACYCTATIGSYDVEREFSAYNEILDDKWQSLDQNTIKAFHFWNWNLRVKSSVEQEKDRPTPASSLPVVEKRVPHATPKQAAKDQVPKDTPKVSKKQMQQTHATTKQRTEDVEITNGHQKGTKRKSVKRLTARFVILGK